MVLLVICSSVFVCWWSWVLVIECELVTHDFRLVLWLFRVGVLRSGRWDDDEEEEDVSISDWTGGTGVMGEDGELNINPVVSSKRIFSETVFIHNLIENDWVLQGAALGIVFNCFLLCGIRRAALLIQSLCLQAQSVDAKRSALPVHDLSQSAATVMFWHGKCLFAERLACKNRRPISWKHAANPSGWRST